MLDIQEGAVFMRMHRLNGGIDRFLAYYETPDAVSITPHTMQEDLHNPQRRLYEKEIDSSPTL